jgi:anti-sigma-K factor RskA
MSLKDSMDPRIEELLPFYALDALTDEEREWVESYLAEHPEARQEINDLHSGASALPYGISPVEPPRHVKEALMARVNADAAAQVRAQPTVQASRRSTPRRSWLENIFQAFSLGAAAVAIIWAIVLNLQVSRLQTEISGLHETLAKQSNTLEQILVNLPKSPSNVITVSIKGTNVEPSAHGQLIADPKEQSAVLIISGLPKLEAHQTYQIWLGSGGTMISAGLLSVDENGQGVVVVTSDESIGSFNQLGISVEPEGGSQQPTGDIVVLSDI